MKTIKKICKEIIEAEENKVFLEQGFSPLFVANENAKIVIVGHAPGIKTQMAGEVWNDKSGKRLIQWLGINEKTFRDEKKIAHLPMDFFYPGKGKTGDLPPRKGFAEKWHPRLLEEMPKVEMFILAGQYAQKYYLGKKMKKNLTETVRAFHDYLPGYFPLIHPSPLNLGWMKKNPWFEEEVLPELKDKLREILRKG